MQVEFLSFSHYAKEVKSKEKVEQISSLLGEKLKSLTQKDLEDLKTVLPEADKNLFMKFRDGIISLDQLKARVNHKMKRATYKCLDDLI